MILLLGHTGYIGSSFAQELHRRDLSFRGISRSEVDYTNRDSLISLIRESKADFLINAAGYTGKPNVDACEIHKSECLQANAVLPGMIRQACELTGIPWGHVSSGCIYTGRRDDGNGFRESDAPNFCFRTNHCSWYSGCKALGEECLVGTDNIYIWRMRIPFNQFDSPRNYLSKLIRYDRLLSAENSISHVDESVHACVESWTQRIPTGIYNVTNPGSITTEQVTALIQTHLLPDKKFKFFASETEFMNSAATTPRSNCILDSRKLLSTGIAMSAVEDAVISALKHWRSANHKKRLSIR
ncbi:sugar nucleotide-binding protein [Rubripirellula amarantea]|nr:sugar nucleotide-binding protein [Rubripirellula amarantea]